MVNKILSVLALLLMSIALPSHAYVIGSDLTIENNTAMPMEIAIKPPKGQPIITRGIPPYQTTTIYIEKGDKSGLLYQASAANFRIREMGGMDDVVSGSVIYYVGGAFWSKYSFLDMVIPWMRKRIPVDKSFSCSNGGNGTVFQNKIILGKEAGGGRSIHNQYTIRCEGLKLSNLRDITHDYEVICSDNKKANFKPVFPAMECGLIAGSKKLTEGCWWSNGEENFSIYPDDIRAEGLKFALDKSVGDKYCQTFEKSAPNIDYASHEDLWGVQ